MEKTWFEDLALSHITDLGVLRLMYDQLKEEENAIFADYQASKAKLEQFKHDEEIALINYQTLVTYTLGLAEEIVWEPHYLPKLESILAESIVQQHYELLPEDKTNTESYCVVSTSDMTEMTILLYRQKDQTGIFYNRTIECEKAFQNLEVLKERTDEQRVEIDKLATQHHRTKALRQKVGKRIKI